MRRLAPTYDQEALTEVVHLPPRGRYLADEAGLLAGVSGQAIGQWARRGSIRSSVSEGLPRVYSFQDVAEAVIVHELLDRGVPHGRILQAVRTLRESHGDWPLAHADLVTSDGAARRVCTSATTSRRMTSGATKRGSR